MNWYQVLYLMKIRLKMVLFWSYCSKKCGLILVLYKTFEKSYMLLATLHTSVWPRNYLKKWEIDCVRVLLHKAENVVENWHWSCTFSTSTKGNATRAAILSSCIRRAYVSVENLLHTTFSPSCWSALNVYTLALLIIFAFSPSPSRVWLASGDPIFM